MLMTILNHMECYIRYDNQIGLDKSFCCTSCDDCSARFCFDLISTRVKEKSKKAKIKNFKNILLCNCRL